MGEKHEEVFKKFGIKEETKYAMDYDDFNKLVEEYLPDLTIDGDRYKDFESIAEFEWCNYSNYDTSVTESDLKEGGFYHKYDKKDIMEGKIGIGFHAVLCFLVDHKIIPFGKYEVKVFW